MTGASTATCCDDSCDLTAFTRNNYWYGKLMLPQDFTDEQRYFRDKMRHHNQRLHGTGVVCGLIVHAGPDTGLPRPVGRRSPPGSALDCCGNEIVLPDADRFDVAALPAVQARSTRSDPAHARAADLPALPRVRAPSPCPSCTTSAAATTGDACPTGSSSPTRSTSSSTRPRTAATRGPARPWSATPTSRFADAHHVRVRPAACVLVAAGQHRLPGRPDQPGHDGLARRRRRRVHATGAVGGRRACCSSSMTTAPARSR